jgi:hypothetical protein
VTNVGWRTAFARPRYGGNGRFLRLFIWNFHDLTPLAVAKNCPEMEKARPVAAPLLKVLLYIFRIAILKGNCDTFRKFIFPAG